MMAALAGKLGSSPLAQAIRARLPGQAEISTKLDAIHKELIAMSEALTALQAEVAQDVAIMQQVAATLASLDAMIATLQANASAPVPDDSAALESLTTQLVTERQALAAALAQVPPAGGGPVTAGGTIASMGTIGNTGTVSSTGTLDSPGTVVSNLGTISSPGTAEGTGMSTLSPMVTTFGTSSATGILESGAAITPDSFAPLPDVGSTILSEVPTSTAAINPAPVVAPTTTINPTGTVAAQGNVASGMTTSNVPMSEASSASPPPIAMPNLPSS